MSNPKTEEGVYKLINGGLCSSHVQQGVCLVASFEAFQGNEKRLMKIKTTDGHVMLAESKTPFTEVIDNGSNLLIEGVLSSKNKIAIDSLSVFPSSDVETGPGQSAFDPRVYNEMVTQFIEHGSTFMEVHDLMDHWGTNDPGPEGVNVTVLNTLGGQGMRATDDFASGAGNFSFGMDTNGKGFNNTTNEPVNDSFNDDFGASTGDLGDF